MKNIIVAVDMEAGDQKLLNQASMLASALGSKLWIIHVAASEPDFVGFDTGPKYIRTTLAQELREEHKELHQYSEKLKATGLNAESLLLQGPTIDTIFSEASKLGADMIVMGSHRHNFLKRVFGDDISHTIIRQSTIPILIVPLS